MISVGVLPDAERWDSPLLVLLSPPLVLYRILAMALRPSLHQRIEKVNLNTLQYERAIYSICSSFAIFCIGR